VRLVWTRVLVVAAVSLAAACRPGAPPGGGDWPQLDTAEVAIGTTEYRLKLDGTVHFQGSPSNLTVTAQAASSGAPAVTRMEVVLNLPGATDPVDRATYPARWVARGSRGEMEARNVFPGPEGIGRRFPAGTYLLRVDLYESDQAVGRLGPLEVYLGYQRTRE
jgi:hypothetical protein